MNKKINVIFYLFAFLSVTLNIYMLLFIPNKVNNSNFIIDNNFIYVIQEVINKIESKNITEEQKKGYEKKLIEIIKKYPK